MAERMRKQQRACSAWDVEGHAGHSGAHDSAHLYCQICLMLDWEMTHKLKEFDAIDLVIVAAYWAFMRVSSIKLFMS